MINYLAKIKAKCSLYRDWWDNILTNDYNERSLEDPKPVIRKGQVLYVYNHEDPETGGYQGLTNRGWAVIDWEQLSVIEESGDWTILEKTPKYENIIKNEIEVLHG